MNDPESVIATLKQLERLGVQLSIDDFGTGYSSLSYLKRFPVSTLKIDQSFVRDLGEGDDPVAIIKAIISLGHSLGLQVIAEGVETEEQMALLLQLKCDAMQGYLFSRPLRGEDFVALLKRESEESSLTPILHQVCGSPAVSQLIGQSANNIRH
jgi:EAL domain-containing protein (putative c-di-GMP-specific phosphodiesterase class I)